MIRIDHTLLEDLGLGELPNRNGRALLSAFYDELQVRVGTRLCEQLGEQRQAELEQLLELSDEDGACAFLDRHAPKHRQIVEQEFARLHESVGSAAPELLAAARREQGAAACDAKRAVQTTSVRFTNRRPTLRTQTSSPTARPQRGSAAEA